MGFLYPRYKMYELKIHRGVMCHDSEEWCKIWRGIDLPFQNWREEFDKFWPEHSKVQKICTLIGSFRKKYIMFELKKVQRSYVSWHWRMMQNLKRNWHVVLKLTWVIWRISTWPLESLKNLHFNGLLLNKVYNVWAKKTQKSYVW